MNGLKFRKKGISLVEIILSIGVLSFLSVYVVQMFIISNQLNEKAEALDQSVILASQIFEQVEISETFDNLLEAPLLDLAIVDKNDDQTDVSLYFDETWKGVAENQPFVYQVHLIHEKMPALDYQIEYYKLTVNQFENLKWEQIYELEMQKYD